ncbi:MAG: Por secretion system protein [Prevotellaceae bacterium]|nr:Por secretion system protein [Prevotellaceae bacterium]
MCIVLLLFAATMLPAQHAIGTWQSYLSYHTPTRCEQIGSLLYIVANNDLYLYDREDAWVRTLYKSAPLSDTEISFIAAQPAWQTLIIVYTNGNIDLLINEEQVRNLPDYKNKQLTQEKRVNQACFYQEYAYLATASGILVLNLKKQEITNFYPMNEEVRACNVADNQLYACTDAAVYAGRLTDNLLDAAAWQRTDEAVADFLARYQDIPFKADIPEGITPNSPRRNYPYAMNFAGERLLIAGGGHVADRLNRAGTIMSFDDNTWSAFQEEDISEYTHHPYRDINCVVQDPNDPGHHFAASAGEGLYEFRDGRFTNNYSMHNSPLESALPNEATAGSYVRVNGLAYDAQANLWMVSCSAQHAVTVLKSNGEWVSLYYPEITEASNFGRTIFDRRGWLWATSSRIESGGLFCLNANGTVDDSSDDRHRFITRFTNQDGTLLEQLAVYSVAEDKEGAIWIGTNQGPLILNNPTRFFDDNFYCTQPKVPRNDGSGLADFLLAGQVVNAIAVDGANRKWVGTAADGIYLLSADGMETIHHFTPDNSPLPSGSIESIVIHPRTGEVYIGTSQGLVSYQSDAVEAQPAFVKGNVRAYPNPVQADYEGPITITGLVYDSDVKIVDITGQLIYQGTSLGGNFVWNGRNRHGQRVATGIYLVLAADSQGKAGIVTKIMLK